MISFGRTRRCSRNRCAMSDACMRPGQEHGGGPVSGGGLGTGRFNRARLFAVGAAVVWVALVLWATGPVMRENDQASLLEGAVELARDPGKWRHNASYSYDKHFFSYWLVAAWLKLTGRTDAGGSIEEAVWRGNLLAALLFSVALLAVVVSEREWSWARGLVLTGVLFSPVMAFSGMFLSPNVLSGAFLLLLVVVLRRPGDESGRSWAGEVVRVGGAGFLAFAATGARQDAILVMPLLALLGVPGRTARAALRRPVLWVLVGGCLAAIVTGRVAGAGYRAVPAPFFVFPTFVTYLAGGLGAVLLLLGAFAAGMARLRTWRGGALCGAVLVPLLFYGGLLYNPRYLLIVALGVLATTVFPRGRRFWDGLGRSRTGRVVVSLVVLGTVAPWLAGIRMAGWAAGRPVAASSTLYPTSDGFWPLGAYGWFLGRLARAAERPIDHNQAIWAAWTTVAADRLPERAKVGIVSSGMESYGRFRLRWAGRNGISSREDAEVLLVDDRALKKQRLDVDTRSDATREQARDLMRPGTTRVIGAAMGRRIMIWSERYGEGPPDSSVSLTMAMAPVYGGNDFRVARWRDAWWRDEALDGHRGTLAARSEPALQRIMEGLEAGGSPRRGNSAYDPEPWWFVPVGGAELDRLRDLPEAATRPLWVTVSMLPAFMDVRSYGK